MLREDAAHVAAQARTVSNQVEHGECPGGELTDRDTGTQDQVTGVRGEQRFGCGGYPLGERTGVGVDSEMIEKGYEAGEHPRQ